MTAKVVALNIDPGIQRDGTQFDTTKYVDGVWVRFQRKRPRKIGGYTAIFLNSTNISRGMQMTAANNLNYLISGYSSGLEQWQTYTYGGQGTGPVQYTLSNFTASPDNLWQFDIGYDATGGSTNNLIAHPGQNLRAIDSTVNTPVLYGLFPGTSGSLTMSKVGVFTQTASTTSSSTSVTLSSINPRIGAGQSVTGTGIPANTTVVSVTGTALVISNAATATNSSVTLTFDNNIAVSGGCVMIHPYLFIYGNNGLIQNCSAGDFNNWVANDANENNVSTGKIVKGLPIRGGSTSPSGLFWSTDSLIRVAYNPTTVTIGTTSNTYYWTYDLVSSQTSIMSSSSVIEYDGIFYWCGVDRFLMYNGVVQEIPNDTNQNYFFDNLNYQQRQKVWVTKVPRWGEIWWFYPKGSATECNDAIIYNVREKVWYDAGQAVGAQRSAGVFTEVFKYPIWSSNASSGYQVISVNIVSGGTNYAVNDTIVLNGGSGSFALFTVATVSGGVVTGLAIVNGGTYASVLSGTLTTTARQPSTGTGLTVTVSMSQTYPLWQHETGTDSVYLSNVDAVQSYIETCNLGAFSNLVGTTLQPGDNMWTRLERVEPDFIQSGQMSLTVTGKGYADDVDQTSAPYYFQPGTLKIDMREQRREMRLHFESNTYGGNYQMGKIILSLTTGDVRSTGNP